MRAVSLLLAAFGADAFGSLPHHDQPQCIGPDSMEVCSCDELIATATSVDLVSYLKLYIAIHSAVFAPTVDEIKPIVESHW